MGPGPAPPPAGPAPPGPSPRPCPSCEAGNRAARIRCCCRAVRSSAAESRPELGRLGCTRSRDPAARDPSLRRRRRPQGAPGRTMVKVTFNSALAQKEAKKDDPKSSEEALIIPPDAVAVDCKVRGWGRGRGPRGGDGRPERPSAPRVPWCVCLGRDGVSALATPAGTVAEACELPQLLHLVWSPGDLQRLAPPQPSLALFFQDKYCA